MNKVQCAIIEVKFISMLSYCSLSFGLFDIREDYVLLFLFQCLGSDFKACNFAVWKYDFLDYAQVNCIFFVFFLVSTNNDHKKNL